MMPSRQGTSKIGRRFQRQKVVLLGTKYLSSIRPRQRLALMKELEEATERIQAR
jgi:hypothetical protein